MSENYKTLDVNFSFKCPACEEGSIKVTKTEYDLSDGDKMLIIKFECDQCNYHNNDIIPLTTRIEPGIMTLKITNESDLKSKVYRSPTGILEIPELELIVEPGPSAEFYYTNIEGILFRFEDAVLIYKKSLQTDSQTLEIDKILENIKKALDGSLPFTLIITDKGGGSYIIPQDNSKYSFITINNLESENL